MSLLDHLRSLFTGNRENKSYSDRLDNNNRDRDSFRNPIWQNDEDDDGIDDFRQPSTIGPFHVWTDPFEITKFFESEMENFLKSFTYGFNHNVFIGEDNSFNALPFEQPEMEGSLRDKVLKPGYETPIVCDQETYKMDADLDGKVTAHDFSQIWDNQNNLGAQRHFTSPNFSVCKSVTKSIIRRSDGIVEQKQTIKTTNGKQETIVTKQIGDKIHRITTKRDKDGTETTVEDLVNMDENELKDFNQKWTSLKKPENNNSKILDYLPWSKFFGANPKL